MRNGSTSPFLARVGYRIILLQLVAGISCQQVPPVVGHTLDHANDEVLKSATLSSSGVLELLPQEGGALYFTSIEILGVAIWATNSYGLHSYYYAYLPEGLPHRISLEEVMGLITPTESELLKDSHEALTVRISGCHVPSPYWPVADSRSARRFQFDVEVSRKWLNTVWRD